MSGWGADYDDEGTQKRLDAFAAHMIDLRAFWPRITNLFVGWMGKQFKTEGAFWNGSPWQPLSPRYAAWKNLHYPGKGILVAEGDLRRGATMLKPSQIQSTPRFLVLTVEWPKKPRKTTRNVTLVARNEQGHVIDRKTGVESFTTFYDVDWHQSGTARMPARPLLQEEYLTPFMQMEVDDEVKDYVDEVAKRVGLA